MATGDSDTCSLPKRHGLTLIEVLIALGLVLALTAIVLPTATWVLRMSALQSARDGVEALLLQARAEAKLTGRSIEVQLLNDRLVAQWFEPSATPLAEGASPAFEPEAPQLIEGAWARRRIPQGIEVLSWSAYQEMMDVLRGPLGRSDQVFEETLAVETPIRVAVLLPDGGALVGTPLVLVDERDEALLLSVDPWTGRAHFETPPVERAEVFEEQEGLEDSNEANREDANLFEQPEAVESMP